MIQAWLTARRQGKSTWLLEKSNYKSLWLCPSTAMFKYTVGGNASIEPYYGTKRVDKSFKVMLIDEFTFVKPELLKSAIELGLPTFMAGTPSQIIKKGKPLPYWYQLYLKSHKITSTIHPLHGDMWSVYSKEQATLELKGEYLMEGVSWSPLLQEIVDLICVKPTISKVDISWELGRPLTETLLHIQEISNTLGLYTRQELLEHYLGKPNAK